LRGKLGALPLGPAALLPRKGPSSNCMNGLYRHGFYGNGYGMLEIRHKAVRAVITVRQQVMKHVTIVRQDAREQSVIKISHQVSRTVKSARGTYPLIFSGG